MNNEFNDCGCGCNSIIIEAIPLPLITYYRHNLFFVKCQRCGEFEPFKGEPFDRENEISKKGMKAWNNANER